MTAREAVRSATDALAAAGCDTPQLDAELLIADALAVDRGAIVADPGLAIPPAAARTIGERVRRRVAREPVAYVLGRKGFRRIELDVDRRVLVPRPETELLVEVALDLPAGARVHEVGTGSGAVALALAGERPDLRVTASDVSADALAVARANGARLSLDVSFELADGLPASLRAATAPAATAHTAPAADAPAATDAQAAIEDRDALALVLANLPYVREDEWAGLAPEIRAHEPRLALVSGADGLDAIRALVAQAPAGTRLALEHAPAQAAAVRGMLDAAETLHDLAGLERVTVGRAR